MAVASSGRDSPARSASWIAVTSLSATTSLETTESSIRLFSSPPRASSLPLLKLIFTLLFAPIVEMTSPSFITSPKTNALVLPSIPTA